VTLVHYIALGWSWLFIVAIVAAGVIGSFVSKAQTRNRTEALRIVAGQLGLTFEGEDWARGPCAPELETPLFDGRSDQTFRNIMSGNRDGLNASFFDFSYGVGKSYVSQTLAAFRQDAWLPQFEMAPRDSVALLNREMLRKQIEFESHPQFAKKYRLLSVDEEKARQVFTSRMLTFFVEDGLHVDWNIEGAGNTLIVYRRGANTKPEDFRGFVEETTRVAKSFFEFSGLKEPFA
jgi:hypothetical protein